MSNFHCPPLVSPQSPEAGRPLPPVIELSIQAQLAAADISKAPRCGNSKHGPLYRNWTEIEIARRVQQAINSANEPTSQPQTEELRPSMFMYNAALDKIKELRDERDKLKQQLQQFKDNT